MPPSEEVNEFEEVKPIETGRLFSQDHFKSLQYEVGKLISIVSSRYEPDEELETIMEGLSELLELPESVHFTTFEWVEQLFDF